MLTSCVPKALFGQSCGRLKKADRKGRITRTRKTIRPDRCKRVCTSPADPVRSMQPIPEPQDLPRMLSSSPRSEECQQCPVDPRRSVQSHARGLPRSSARYPRRPAPLAEPSFGQHTSNVPRYRLKPTLQPEPVGFRLYRPRLCVELREETALPVVSGRSVGVPVLKRLGRIPRLASVFGNRLVY